MTGGFAGGLEGGWAGGAGGLAFPTFPRALNTKEVSIHFYSNRKYSRKSDTKSSDARGERGRASVKVRRAAKARKRRVCFMRAIVNVKEKFRIESEI